MRTIRIKVYNFEELSKEAKKKFMEWYRDMAISNGLDWEKENRGSFYTFMALFGGMKIDRHGDFVCFGDGPLWELSGVRLATYLYNNFKFDLYKQKIVNGIVTAGIATKSRKSNIWVDRSCVMTGYYMDDVILSPIYRFIDYPQTGVTFEYLANDALNEWVKALNREQRYQLSDEYITDAIIANRYEFTRDGNRY